MREASPTLGVVFLSGFAKPEECMDLLRAAELQNSWHPAKVGEYEHNNLVVAVVDPQATTAEVTTDFESTTGILPRVRNAATLIARRQFGLEIETFSKASMSRYAPGAQVGRHRDTTALSTDRLITVILYLNDDFEGGELVFPDLGFSYSPTCGDVAVFLSEYFHSVRPVMRSYRYCVIQFGLNKAS